MSDEIKNEENQSVVDNLNGVQDLHGEEVVKKKNFFHKECKKCKDLEEKCEEYKNDWQRALADYKNLQREVEKRRSEWAQLSELQIIEEFLPVYDNFKKAFAIEEANDSWRQGIGYIMKQFGDVLKAHNIEEIKTVGEKFDPNLHDASGEAPSSDGVQEPGIIVKEVTGGYKMGDRVIRAARVIVTK
jgi:molecular chaperone GrpE